MKKIFIFLLLSVSVCEAQNIINNNINIGVVDSLHSTVLNETQRFWISVPTSYYDPRFSKARFPVIYVFDGDANFATVAAMQKQLSVRNGNTVLPEAIVVGVMNNDRTRDFTPYPSSYNIYGPPSPLTNTGGGERFVEYLQKELIPHIDSLYSTSPYRVLLGHSLGGLAATNILVNHTDLFRAYIIMDPSMWYDNQGFLKKARTVLANKKLNGITVYLAMANTLEPGYTVSTVLKDKSNQTMHMRSIILLKKLLESKLRSGIRFKFDYYSDNTHMSLPLIAEYTGLRFIFNYYQIPPNLEIAFLDPKNHIDPTEILVEHYKVISAHLGYNVLPSEILINKMANTMAENSNPKKALGLYELNVKNYPASYDAWLRLGQFCEDQNENKRAISCYEKAFVLKDSPEIGAKLRKLRSK